MNLTDRPQKLEQLGRYHSFAALLLVYLLPIGGLTGVSQSVPPSAPAPPAIAVKTELVVLPVRIVDGNGDFVSGLGVDNFRVFEDGRQQRISLFQREDTPVTVGLVVDHSRSMGPKLAEVATAILSFAQAGNPEDEMFVVDFNDSVSLELPSGQAFTHDPAEFAKAVSAVSADGGTALYDAVYQGLKHLELAHGDKKALVIVSDGGDNASKHKYSEVLALARRSQAVIYSIGLIGAPNEQEQNRKILERLCNDTGGMAFFPEARQAVTKVSTRIARALREQYTLGFTPDKTDSDHFRKIQVKVTAPGRGKIRVQTRPGYEKPANPEKRPS